MLNPKATFARIELLFGVPFTHRPDTACGCLVSRGVVRLQASTQRTPAPIYTACRIIVSARLNSPEARFAHVTPTCDLDLAPKPDAACGRLGGDDDDKITPGSRGAQNAIRVTLLEVEGPKIQ